MAHHGGMGTWACLGMCLVMMVPMVLPTLVRTMAWLRRTGQDLEGMRLQGLALLGSTGY